MKVNTIITGAVPSGVKLQIVPKDAQEESTLRLFWRSDVYVVPGELNRATGLTSLELIIKPVRG